MADAFISGAEQAEHTAVKYASAHKKIKGCVDCKTCFSKGATCPFLDDLNTLAPLVEQADMIVFATQLYRFSFPVQLKAAIDKFFSLSNWKKKIKNKRICPS